MKLREVLALPSMAGARLVAGESGLDRDVRWSHVVDMPDPVKWIRPGFMLLLSGYSWPAGLDEQRAQIAALDAAGVSAIGLAVPKYLDHFSEQARSQANRVGVPLLEIPWETPFARIMEELHRTVMAEPYEIIARSEQIHRALTRAASRDAGLEDLAKSLCALIGRSVTFEDPAGKLLAHCSVNGAQDSVREHTLEHAQTPAGMMRALEDGGLMAEIRLSEQPVRVPAMPQLGASPRVVCPIRIGSDLAGLVWIIEGDRPLSELDHRAAEHAALVAAIHIAHQRELASVEARLGYASFLSLLESKPGEKPVAEERARLLGFDSRARYRVGIVLVPEELPLGREGVLRRDRVASRVRESLRAMAAEQLVTVNLDQVPFLLPEGKSGEALYNALAEPELSVVFGRVHEGAAGARESYREAVSLIAYRHRGSVCYYEDLLVPRVIMGDAAARESFLNELFAPLRSRKGGANLIRALLSLARSGFRFGETAATLGIHPNTLRYRLERARSLMAIDLDDPDVRFRLQLASRLLDLVDRRS
ncbi:MAG TPA: PucR family transcriptional regulator ligand-binding domain-containing protein [Candidatus Baltobacteraceae bacterium]|jgi:purine catabolism regulator|nr:PucR family transcriptional regulator ligand-binding domain-containing protein [Candidatus Baltobacteraceae bacterium]